MNAQLPKTLRDFSLSACWCCSSGPALPHCPSCHTVAMHGLTDFLYLTVALGLPVYWGYDQGNAIRAAEAGAGVVVALPILADYRHRAAEREFRPAVVTPDGTLPVPLDAVRWQRNADGAALSTHQQREHPQHGTAGHTHSDRPDLPGPQRTPAEWPLRKPMPTPVTARLSAQLAEAAQLVCPAQGMSGVPTCRCHGQNGPSGPPESTESAQHAERLPGEAGWRSVP